MKRVYRQNNFGPLVSSQKRKALAVSVINRLLIARQSHVMFLHPVNIGFTVFVPSKRRLELVSSVAASPDRARNSFFLGASTCRCAGSTHLPPWYLAAPPRPEPPRPRRPPRRCVPPRPVPPVVYPGFGFDRLIFRSIFQLKDRFENRDRCSILLTSETCRVVARKDSLISNNRITH